MTETRVRNALAAFLFKGEEVYRPLSVCSGGERARVALLKLMLGGYNFLLLDEPTNHLDAASREELENTLLHYDGTMLIVSHDRYFINKLATRVLELTPNGVQSYTGNYDDYMAHRAVTQQRTAAVKEKPKTNSYKEQRSVPPACASCVPPLPGWKRKLRRRRRRLKNCKRSCLPVRTIRR